jgi:hypothetical protein
MNATESPEMKQYRTVAAVTRTVVLLGVVAALAAIGARAPDASIAATNCAYAAAPTGTLSDATLELSAACGGGALESVEPATAEAKYGVPDAKTALDPRAQPEAQPATF